MFARSVTRAVAVRVDADLVLADSAERAEAGDGGTDARRVEGESERRTLTVVDVHAERDERVASVEQHDAVLSEEDLPVEARVGRSEIVLRVNRESVV